MFKLSILPLLVGLTLASDVLELSDENFKNIVTDKEIILVEFFAPWCGHCKRLAPEYEKAATALKSNDPPVPLAKVDCTEAGKDTCGKYGVSGYPTLKIFRSGEMSQDYDGPRDAGGIVSYMKNNAGPSSITLKDTDHLRTKLDTSSNVLIVGFFTGENDLHKQFMKVADQKRTDYNFAHSTDTEINKEYQHHDEIVLFRPKHMHAKFEDPKEVLSNKEANVNQIKDFIDEKHAGLVGQMIPSNEASFKKPVVVAYFEIDWKKNPKGSRYWRNRVARVAKKHVGDITFAIANKEDYSRQLNDWSLQDEINIVARNTKGQVYKMNEKFSVDTLQKFVNEFKEGKLKAYIKSEPVPESNDGPVKVVVGETFDQIVNDPSKDVLIEFYAPWCGHCKSLEPKYTELGEKLSGVKDVVIAKMDATANDSPPPFDVQGFPTIYWAPMGNKVNPKKYQGGREVADFFEFIQREATNPVEIGEKKKKKRKKAKTDL